MILISHRGNVSGSIPEKENHPLYIQEALDRGFNVEVDIRYIDDEFWLGHDGPQYKIHFDWIWTRRSKLWVHCKDISSIVFFNVANTYSPDNSVNYFWHDTDTVTLTSQGYLWAFPGNQPIVGSIAVMPELGNDDISSAMGVCSDYILNFK